MYDFDFNITGLALSLLSFANILLVIDNAFVLFIPAMCLYVSESAIEKVSSAYLMIVKIMSAIVSPSKSSSSFRIVSLYRLPKSEEKRHPCFATLSILRFKFPLSNFWW